jgi:hypothetical protein
VDQNSRLASFTHDDANEIGDILGPKLAHDVRTMDLDGAGTDPQLGGDRRMGSGL